MWRAIVGCLLVVALSAAATVVAIKGEISTLAGDLSFHKAIALSARSLAPVGFGDPETILLIGNDQRNHTTTAPVLPHSNEMLLVRIDPSKPWISMMSIPRELEVTFQTANGPVSTRLNAALIYGGMPLLLSTIKQLTGVSINHVVMIDFNEFKNAVNEIGCVYTTIDERYYHVNTPYDEQYQEINLQPGYQKLCGTGALQYVSYRHGDTSLVRDARDQDFLLDVKKEYGPTLLENIHKFERIFGQTVEVDRGLQTDSGVENLLGTLISSESLRVRQVQFQVDLQPIGANPCNCDTATPQEIAASVRSFLYGIDTLPTQSTVAAAHAVQRRNAAANLPLVPTSAAELAQARASAPNMPITLEFPRVQDVGVSALPVDLRSYLIHGPDGSAYPAYVAVFSAGLLGQYYDVQGMTWIGAPMFANPDQTITVGGRNYSLYYSGEHLAVVAWYANGAVYWVHNTLTDAVGNGELWRSPSRRRRSGRPRASQQ
ncbi:MAG: LCP family protein [Solirubrobacteraceae bacterium]